MAARRPGTPAAADGSIAADVLILRRIAPKRVNKKDIPDRPDSDAFGLKRGEDGVSVDLWVDENSPEKTIGRATIQLPQGQEWGVVWLRVGDVRKLELDVIPNPKPENPFHALIVGTFTESVPRKLAKLAAGGWYKKPVPEK